jgi:hypothetical protein
MSALVPSLNIWNLLGLIKKEAEFESIVMESTPEILSRLKLLGHIQKGEKISSRTMVLQPDGWATRLNRMWISPDNRNNTLKLVREIISRSFEILTHNITSQRESEIIQCKLIIQDLMKAQNGLLNLKSTYSDDIKFRCDLDILLQQIVARLAEVRKGYGSLFDPDPLQQIIEPRGDTDNSLP